MTETRPATTDDLQTILTYRRKLQHHLQKSNPRIWRRNKDTTLREEALDEITGDKKWTIIAEEKHKPVGYISGRAIIRRDEEPPTIGVISTMWVEPSHRNRGIGTRLVRDLLKRFSREGVQDITLRYVIGNKEAETFWTGLGFEPRITVANAEPSRVLDALSKKPFNQE